MWLVGVVSGCGQWVCLIGVISACGQWCDQWVWSMVVSIGGGFTGKPEVSLFLLSVSFFAASFLLPSFFV